MNPRRDPAAFLILFIAMAAAWFMWPDGGDEQTPPASPPAVEVTK